MKRSPLTGISIAHLCSGYSMQKLYREMLRALSSRGATQIMYAPVRTRLEINMNRDKSIDDVAFVYSHVLRKYHRLLYRTKISHIYKDVSRKIELDNVDLIHAHFLYSDGAVAYEGKRAFGIPYIVSIRNTDLNVFQKYRPDLRRISKKILEGASYVVFLCPKYRDRLAAYYGERFRGVLLEKSRVIPNGIDPFWYEPSDNLRIKGTDKIRLIYVGNFSRNKNLSNLVRAVRMVANKMPVSLTLVGADPSKLSCARNTLLKGVPSDLIQVLPHATKSELKALYRNNDIFVMPSITETFGLVYIEALSQGLPIVHSSGEGVDGYFEAGGVAESVNPKDPEDIGRKIIRLKHRLDTIRDQCVVEASRFNWDVVGDSYARLYAATIGKDKISGHCT